MKIRHVFFLGVCLAFLMTSCGRRPVRIVLDFNKEWEFSLAADNEDSLVWQKVDVPHDWSIEGPFDKNHPATPSGGALPGEKERTKRSLLLNQTRRDSAFLWNLMGCIEKAGSL